MLSDLKRNMMLRLLRLRHSQPASVRSEIPFDVVIPVIEKDLTVLPHVIEAARKNVLHDIGEIFVVSPDSEPVRRLCHAMNCSYVLESTILPVGKKDIQYTFKGIDRSGWLFQQLLKLSADTLSSKKHILILDADTILIRPQIFVAGGVTTFNCSDEYHTPYFTAYRNLLGEKPGAPFSFVSHHMLFDRERLDELRRRIEFYSKKKWFEAVLENVDRTHKSGFSEYETYGNFMFANYRREMRLEYCFNKRLKRKDLKNYDSLNVARLSKRCKSVSFQSYDL